MSFKSTKQRGFLEEKFHKENPSIIKPTNTSSYAKNIQMPSMNAPNKFLRLKNIMKKGGF